MPLLESRNFYKPFEYPWAFEAYEIQRRINWDKKQIPMADDIADWSGKDKNGNPILSESEKAFLTDVFLFFTQGDIDIASGYARVFIPMFRPPEIVIMLTQFAATENIHIDSYSHLIESLNMPANTYSRFSAFPEMIAKHDFLAGFHSDVKKNPLEIALALAVFSAFSEGMFLFSSFAMLLNFVRTDGGRIAKMKGMGQIITYSVRDETLHFTKMIQLFKQFRKEYIFGENTALLEDRVASVAIDMVKLELSFIDLAYSTQNEMNGLAKTDLKRYIKYIADRRMEQMGYSPIYGIAANPLPWLEGILNGVEHANFFETHPTLYAEHSSTGTWDEVWKQLDKGKTT